MLEPLSIDHFSELVSSEFTAHAAQGSVVLRLLEATTLKASGAGRAEPFSLIFVGPRDAQLAQGMYALEHAALPGLEVFIVPVGMTEAGVEYQAIFN